MAGPVVAAAVVLRNSDCLPHLNDSKLLPADARLKLFDEILENASAIGVGIIPPETIDQINILAGNPAGNEPCSDGDQPIA